MMRGLDTTNVLKNTYRLNDCGLYYTGKNSSLERSGLTKFEGRLLGAQGGRYCVWDVASSAGISGNRHVASCQCQLDPDGPETFFLTNEAGAGGGGAGGPAGEIPEPASPLLAGGGLLFVIGLRHSRRAFKAID